MGIPWDGTVANCHGTGQKNVPCGQAWERSTRILIETLVDC